MAFKYLPSAIILAAGKSERMGMPKFALKFNRHRTFLEEIVGQFDSFGCKEIIVVMNKEGRKLIDEMEIKLPENVIIANNPYPELGRFSSIKTGLGFLRNTDSLFLHNVDNPFVNRNVLRRLFNNDNNADYYVPVHENRGGHPILLTGKVVNEIRKCPNVDFSLKEYLKAYRKTVVEVDDPGIFININSPEDYVKAIGTSNSY